MAAPNRLQKEEKDEKRSRVLILLLLLLLLIAIGVIVWMLFFRQDKVLAPDYAPRQEDKYAQSMNDGDTGKPEQSQGGGAVSLMYGTDVTVDLSTEKVSLLFGNPSESNQDMVVQLVVQDVVLAQSDRVAPGKEIRTMDLLSGTASRLQAGPYSGKLVVLFYQPDSGEKAIVNTEIDMDVTVK